MDLTIQLNDSKLNIRVAVLLKTKEGYIFEKHKAGYYFTLGGRIKLNESSLEAARREVMEEIGHDLGEVRLISIIENFFDHTDSSFHEICFVYTSDEVVEIDLPEEFAQISTDDLISSDIKPEIIKKIIVGSGDGASHHIVNSR